MKTDTKADIIPLFKHFIQGLSPYLEANHISVLFSTSINEWHTNYDPFNLIKNLSKLFEIYTSLEYPLEIHLELDKSDKCDFELMLKCSLPCPVNAKNAEVSNQLQQAFGAKNVQIEKDKSLIYFIEKPSNPERLVKVPSLSQYDIPRYYSEIRKRLKSHFSSISSIEEMATKRNLEDGLFLKYVNQAIVDNLQNEHFRMNDLSKVLGLSRTQLYRKLKPLIKMTPARYLIYFRLQKARTLLQETTYNVGQVVTMVGFSSHSHFTRSFSEQFGINPSSIQRNSPEEH